MGVCFLFGCVFEPYTLFHLSHFRAAACCRRQNFSTCQRDANAAPTRLHGVYTPAPADLAVTLFAHDGAHCIPQSGVGLLFSRVAGGGVEGVF